MNFGAPLASILGSLASIVPAWQTGSIGGSMKNSRVGDLLVASTMVEGTILQRGVCLLVHDDEERAIGVMLNRPLQPAAVSTQEHNANEGPSNSTRDASPTNHRLASMPETDGGPNGIQEGGASDQANHLGGSNHPLSPGPILAGSSLYFGGPLAGPVVAIHGTVELAEAEAGEGIFMAAQRDHLETLLRTEQPHSYRLIVGHLGWTQTQLNHEIADGVWHRMPATSDILGTEDGFLWPTLIQRATSQSVSRWIGVEHAADAHRLN